MAIIEIDNKKIEAEAGRMIIEVADEAGIHIPRFCYHKKLSVAANCRMCLVELDKVKKTVPACATPVSDGMKVFTKSKNAIHSQKVVMEFLLINHPLDCPVCDQGGECELQDLSMGYGSDISRFTEGKRSVDDEDIGSLISTEMTRCIHCTRCVRFGEEIAGIRELGATGRGENMRIGTFVKHSLTSPVSGNIIDLCPVGALTSKPFRFKARAWELQQKDSIAPHDCLGSNIHVHVRRGKVMRVVPKENEEINETWLSDRDRFSYLGLLSEDRLAKPLVKENGEWKETDWQTALRVAAEGIRHVINKHGADQLASVISPSATLEECYLLQKLSRALGSNNIDHRSRQTDFSDQAYAPLFPTMTTKIADIEQQQAILVVGGDLEHELPLITIRMRKAQTQGAAVMGINSIADTINVPVDTSVLVDQEQYALVLAEIAKVLSGTEQLPKEFAPLLRNVNPRTESKKMAENFKKSTASVIILTQGAINHPYAASILSLTKLISKLCGANIMSAPVGANSAGAWIAGAVPHRTTAGVAVDSPGLHVNDMLKQKCRGFLLMGIEPELDCNNPALTINVLENAEFVVALSAYRNKKMMDYADVIFPMSVFSETSGTFVNVEGKWQRFNGCVKSYAESRPGWKILRVLANTLELQGFDYTSTQEVHDEVQMICKQNEEHDLEGWYYPSTIEIPSQLRRIGTSSSYYIDSIVRRAQSLHEAASNKELQIRVHPNVGQQYNMRNGKLATVIQNGGELTCQVLLDEGVSPNSVFLASCHDETAMLGEAYGVVELK